MRVLDRDNKEIDLKQNFDDDDSSGLIPADTELFMGDVEVEGELAQAGFEIEQPDGEDLFDDTLEEFDDIGFDEENDNSTKE